MSASSTSAEEQESLLLVSPAGSDCLAGDLLEAFGVVATEEERFLDASEERFWLVTFVLPSSLAGSAAGFSSSTGGIQGQP